MHKTPTPYKDLNALLTQFVQEHQSILADNLVGIYLQGSFAIGDYDEFSDVDFIVVTQNSLAPEQIDNLQQIHRKIYQLDNPWSEFLEGSYIDLTMLQNAQTVGENLWYLDNGADEMHQSNHCNTLVVRWILRENSLPLIGPELKTMMQPIAIHALRCEIFDVIVNWGQDILANPDHFKNTFYQIFIAVNFARMMNDMRRGYPSSKKAGVDYAKANLAPQWGALMDRSMARRGKASITVRQQPDEDDWQLTLDFVRHMINLANDYAKENNL